MYPTFCTFTDESLTSDPYFEQVSVQCGLGPALPGLAVSDHGDTVQVVISVDGREHAIRRSAVRFGLSDAAALAMMDAVEEAIEDVLDAVPLDLSLLERMESTLLLLESILPAD